jgi:undecaprenyl-diphosphatase
MLLVTAVILLLSGLVHPNSRKVNFWRALVIGVAQLGAVMPGISRSGSTIATALYLGVEPLRAARFSFLLSVPAVAAAFALKVRDLLEAPIAATTVEAYGLGALVAFAVGLIAIHYLLKLVAANRFFLFGFWCLLAGAVTLLFI